MTENGKALPLTAAAEAGNSEQNVNRLQLGLVDEGIVDGGAASADPKVKEMTDEKNLNLKNLVCARCHSIVLLPRLAEAVQKEFFLAHMKKKSAKQEPTDGETLVDFWLVKGMYTFENVGFTNTVGSTKYLICADCEVGPIGWHDITAKDCFYVAVDRVKYT